MENNTNSTTTAENTTNTTTTTTPDEHTKERERLLSENQTLRAKAKEVEGKLSQVSEEIQALKRAGHKTSGDWQKVAELNETEAKTYKTKFEQANAAFVNTLTGSRIREEALKQGLKADLVDLVDGMEFDEVEALIDENNRFQVKGVETAVANLKKLKPSLFTDAPPPKFNPGSGGGGGTTNAKPGSVKEAQAALLAARSNRFKNPQAYQQALENLNSVAIEARKAKH